MGAPQIIEDQKNNTVASEKSLSAALGLLVQEPDLIIRFTRSEYDRGGPKMRDASVIELGADAYTLVVRGLGAAAERLTISFLGPHPVLQSNGQPSGAKVAGIPRTINLVRGDKLALPRFAARITNRRVYDALEDMGVVVGEEADQFVRLDLGKLPLFASSDEFVRLPTLLAHLAHRRAELEQVQGAIKRSSFKGKGAAMRDFSPSQSHAKSGRITTETKGETYELPCAVYTLEPSPSTAQKDDIRPAKSAGKLMQLLRRRENLAADIAKLHLQTRLLTIACERGEFGDLGWMDVTSPHARTKKRLSTTRIGGRRICRKSWLERVTR